MAYRISATSNDWLPTVDANGAENYDSWSITQGATRFDWAPSEKDSHPVQTSRGPLSITMSLGVLSSRDWDLQLVEDILVETDLALYQAKAEGRNCVRLAKPSVLSDIPRKRIR